MAGRRLTHQQLLRIQATRAARRERAQLRAQEQPPEPDAGDLGGEQPGLILANYGPAVTVEAADGGLHRCAVRQHLGTLVSGDRVYWQTSSAGEGVVVALEPRHSLLQRPDYSGRSRPLAANLDRVAVVVAPLPELNEFLIDRYLVAIERLGLPALLVLNKIDLLDAAARAAVEARLGTYTAIGYPVLEASTRDALGLTALRRALSDGTSILVGQSGVGKSSLVNALLPDLDIRTQAVSEATGMGTHTTTTAMLYHLPDGGDLIDSPGVRSFELGGLTAADLDRGFTEFAPFLGRCRFSNCSHRVEPECALREAVADGVIDARRLESYHQLRATLPGR